MKQVLRISAFCLLCTSLPACQLILPAVDEQPAQEVPTESVVPSSSVEVAQSSAANSDAQVAEISPIESSISENTITEPTVTETATVEKVDIETRAAEQKDPASVFVEVAPLSVPGYQSQLQQLCHEIGNKLGSVSVNDCLQQNMQYAGGFSVKQRILASREFLPPADLTAVPRILIMGGIHGDEYSSISIMFKWMNIMAQQSDSQFHWRFLPLVNPDGLLEARGQRQNANGVDLNRNFPSADWESTAIETWKTSTGSNPRRFPGSKAASEPETQWLIKQIEDFDPVIIVSVHAPHDLLDFDGPIEPPRRIGQLYLHQLGVYPGSLGNWGGLDLGIPVVTLELPSAGIMPSSEHIQMMWDDLHNWLNANAPQLTAEQIRRENVAGS